MTVNDEAVIRLKYASMSPEASTIYRPTDMQLYAKKHSGAVWKCATNRRDTQDDDLVRRSVTTLSARGIDDTVTY